MQGGQGGGIVMLIIQLAILAFMIVCGWKVFTKAGKPGWAIFIPIYNAIVFLDIAGKPWWWLFLFCIPVVNFVIAILVAISLAQNFGKSAGFGVGLALLGIVFYPILAFGDAQYQGNAGGAA